MLAAFALLVEGDVGDLVVLAVWAAVVVVDGLDTDGLAKDVVVAGTVELRFALAELFDDLVDGDTGGWRGVEVSEACGVFCGSVWICDSGEGPGGGRR